MKHTCRRVRFGKSIFWAVLFSLVFAVGSWAGEAKYVFFFIGDGMSIPQRNVAEMFLGTAHQEDGVPKIVKLAMDTLPYQGICTTFSTNSLITDSAAAGTALATGNKTKSGIVGMDSAGKESFKSIAVRAKEKGKKVGILSSVSIEHATPASFYAHTPSRSNYYDIACQLTKTNFDYFGGGGFRRPTGKEKNQKSIFDMLQEENFKVTQTREDFQALKPGEGKVVAINPVLDRSKALPYAIDAKEGISLKEFTAKGVELLQDSPKGFFMMVEGGKIDWACHANDAVTSIKDTLALDEAVKVALDFYKEHPEETLIVVTGDHETGGLTLGFAGTKYETYFYELAGQKESYDVFNRTVDTYRKAHSGEGAPAPIFEDMIPVVQDVFGLTILTAEERKALDEKAAQGDEEAKNALAKAVQPFEEKDLRKAFEASMKGGGGGYGSNKTMSPQEYLLYGFYEPFTVTITHILNRKAGVAWTSYSHTGLPVPVSAIGVGGEQFNGYYDNTDIPKKIASAMGL